jgi:oligopeptidase B
MPSVIESSTCVHVRKNSQDARNWRSRFWSRSLCLKRVWATAKDGVKVPISLVYKKRIWEKKETIIAIWLEGVMVIRSILIFSISRLSLLNRGFVCDRTRAWRWIFWDASGMIRQDVSKVNTFTDFVCSEYLWSTPWKRTPMPAVDLQVDC